MFEKVIDKLENGYVEHLAACPQFPAPYKPAPPIYFTMGDKRGFVWCQMCLWTMEARIK
jgi:hypothetical protein